jgi:dihydroorotate dehydrogenase
MRNIPPEFAHHTAFVGLRFIEPALRGSDRAAPFLSPDPRLAKRVWDVDFPGPLGLAAGFDKNAEGPDALGALGFGFVEVGTVTPRPQPGNPPPRLFRLYDDHALINRLGFNNAGVEALAEKLERRRDARLPIGVNIGKNKDTSADDAASDYARCAQRIAALASYCVVNVSSPNTVGLRDLQAEEQLLPIIEATRTALDRESRKRHVPLCVKIAPDLADDAVVRIAELAVRVGLDGIIATNTTISREGLATEGALAEEIGGLSGEPLRTRSMEVLRLLRDAGGDKLALVSVGGIATSADAATRLDAGATLLQAYTAFIYEGPLFAWRIHRGLAKRLSDGPA